jgi:hypothetical protein
MFWSRRNLFRRPLIRRLCSGLALIAYLVAAIGFPLPIPAEKESSQPFPCQGHQCGCRTAEQCWSHCCCLSPEERWAWARAHNVQPPGYAEKPSGHGWQTTRRRDRDRTNEKSACCCKKQSSAGASTGSCCQTKHQKSSHCPTCAARAKDPTPKAPQSNVRWQLGFNVLNCQGLASLWVGAGAVMPPPPIITWAPCEVGCGWLADVDIQTDLLSFRPSVPPPRFAV